MGGKPRQKPQPRFDYVILRQEDFEEIKAWCQQVKINCRLSSIELWPIDMPNELDSKRSYRMYEV